MLIVIGGLVLTALVVSNGADASLTEWTHDGDEVFFATREPRNQERGAEDRFADGVTVVEGCKLATASTDADRLHTSRASPRKGGVLTVTVSFWLLSLGRWAALRTPTRSVAYADGYGEVGSVTSCAVTSVEAGRQQRLTRRLTRSQLWQLRARRASACGNDRPTGGDWPCDWPGDLLDDWPCDWPWPACLALSSGLRLSPPLRRLSSLRRRVPVSPRSSTCSALRPSRVRRLAWKYASDVGGDAEVGEQVW